MYPSEDIHRWTLVFTGRELCSFSEWEPLQASDTLQLQTLDLEGNLLDCRRWILFVEHK